ncbi:hydroxymyristoyl-ACP dehydratase [Dokdonella sp.]|uniref:hydroxymyristoyl-ACP dehydratase n=1 Tax=Dokdonella sp. TaxID=2291710 RepID=UPI0037851EA9
MSARIRIEVDHPSLPGHFPGNPVVPGVVLLDRVAQALARDAGGTIARIRVVKFHAPLLPCEDAELSIERDDQRARFRIERAGQPLLSGEAELA